MAQEYYADALPRGFVVEGYRIERVLGRGGFAFTYLAWSPADEYSRPVALKEYFPQDVAQRRGRKVTALGGSESRDIFQWGLNEFRKEGSVLARFGDGSLGLASRHIVGVRKFIEASETLGTCYLVMDYIEGQNLGEYLSEVDGGIPEADLIRIACDVLEGLSVVHKENVLHRDIHPGNIRLRAADKTPVLIDFGSARVALSSRLAGLNPDSKVVVAEGYAPPEQHDRAGQGQGPWSDIYSVGATLYRAVAGQPPPIATSRSTALNNHVSDPMVPAVIAGKGRYSRALLAAIDKALKVKWSERFSSASAFRKAILGAKPASSFAGRRWKKIAAAIGIAAVAATVAAFWLYDPGPAVEAHEADYAPLERLAMYASPDTASARFGNVELSPDDAVAIVGKVRGKNWLKAIHLGQGGFVPAEKLKQVDREEAAAWRSVDRASRASLEAFVNRYGNGHFAPRARSLLGELGQQRPWPPPVVAWGPTVEPADELHAPTQRTGAFQQPDGTSPQVAALSPIDVVTVTGKVAGTDWLRVIHGGQVGYVRRGMLVPLDRAEAEAWRQLDRTNLIELQKFIDRFPSGHFVSEARRLRDLLLQERPAVPGPRFEDLNSAYVTLSRRNLRSEPQFDSSNIFKILPSNECFIVSGRVVGENWLRVDEEDRPGFVFLDGMLREIDPGECRAWKRVDRTSRSSLEVFLAQHPTGYYARLARDLLVRLPAPEPPVPAPPPGPIPPERAPQSPPLALPAPSTSPSPPPVVPSLAHPLDGVWKGLVQIDYRDDTRGDIKNNCREGYAEITIRGGRIVDLEFWKDQTRPGPKNNWYYKLGPVGDWGEIKLLEGRLGTDGAESRLRISLNVQGKIMGHGYMNFDYRIHFNSSSNKAEGRWAINDSRSCMGKVSLERK
jgi:hypothetical protein